MLEIFAPHSTGRAKRKALYSGMGTLSVTLKLMKIGIVGLGLIGGSLGLDFKVLGQHSLIGISRHPDTCFRALERGIVDEASTDLLRLSEADVIFICTPIAHICPTLQRLAPALMPHTVVTDVGSVKAPIVSVATELWPNFVGGHPMAGTAESGIEAAQLKLFVDRPYVLTPTPTTPPEAIATLTELVRSLQSRVYLCQPEEHDRAVAWISHLPVMISASLISSCIDEPDRAVNKLARELASSGFRDTSRVGGGNPELGLMMAQYNRAAVLRSLTAYQQQLKQVTDLIQDERWTDLETLLQRTQQERPSYV